jgi:branched-chain amino acid transport system ATP-binding protein
MIYETFLLEVRDLWAGYANMNILTGLSLTLRKGESVGLMGTNGSGKTTLLRTICGLIHPNVGKIEFLGQDITTLSPERRVALGIAYVPESREIFAKQSVKANLKLGAYGRIRKFAVKYYKKDFDFVLSIFPRLGGRLNQLSGTLSGGEQQMLAIGRGLMSQPQLLMLDEPSTGLAPIVAKDIFKALRKLNQETNLTVCLVEQNTKLALRMVQRGYIIERGRIVRADHAKALLDYLNTAGLTYG